MISKKSNEVINLHWFLICSWTFHHLMKIFLRNLNLDENKSLYESTRSTNIHLKILWAIIHIFYKTAFNSKKSSNFFVRFHYRVLQLFNRESCICICLKYILKMAQEHLCSTHYRKPTVVKERA